MKNAALAFLICMIFAPLTIAQQLPEDAPASREDIQKYFDAVHVNEVNAKMLDAMRTQVERMIHEQIAKNPSVPPDFEARMDRQFDEMMKSFPVDEIMQAMIPAYQHHLTKGDVEALTAFYSTPRGQRILNELPAMTAEGMQAASGIMQRTMANYMQHVQAEMAQLQKSKSGNSGQAAVSQP